MQSFLSNLTSRIKETSWWILHKSGLMPILSQSQYACENLEPSLKSQLKWEAGKESSREPRIGVGRKGRNTGIFSTAQTHKSWSIKSLRISFVTYKKIITSGKISDGKHLSPLCFLLCRYTIPALSPHSPCIPQHSTQISH